MLDLLKSLTIKVKDIAYKLGLIADYVVEQGTSGVWTYRKWNSGQFEVWTSERQFATGVASGSSTMGYDYYIHISIPSGFINIGAVSGNVSANPDTTPRWGAFVGWRWDSPNPTKLYLYTSGAYQNANIGYAVEIKGRWK